MAERLKYPIGIQTFSKIRRGGFVYIDKTGYIKGLVNLPLYYFLSRPRRFGKSLLLTTLQSYFEGDRDLFKGLCIDTDDTDWTPHPVFLLSLNSFNPKTKESIEDLLSNILSRYETAYDCPAETKDLPQRFENIIIKAHEKTGQPVVILVDEYDSPLLSTLERPDLNEYYRLVLKGLFSVLKSADKHIHFAFVTGVSRFSQTSLFSGANHLTDISFDDRYSGICGITEEEMRNHLHESVSRLAIKLKVSEEEAFNVLKDNYDGYHFSEESPDIYNPFSLLSALESKRIEDFWFRSGTPSYLIDVMKKDYFYLPDLDCIETQESGLSVKESYLNNPIALLFETGYLTIKKYDDEKRSYTLGLPNKEVAESFSKALMPIYSGFSEIQCEDILNKMRSAIIDGEPDRFMILLQTFLEGNPYGNTEMARRESYFKNNIYIIFKALGFLPRVEEHTCRSRMDVMLRTRRFIYIFELKTDGSIEKAMDQIDEKGYAIPYLHSDKSVILIAANYSTKRNNIDGWEISRK
ncbi:MAG: ATP-binding protein [Muribaculaceae bacterium]|nr:ATP-binding protein [Muribaculaceae bacterium]